MADFTESASMSRLRTRNGNRLPVFFWNTHRIVAVFTSNTCTLLDGGQVYSVSCVSHSRSSTVVDDKVSSPYDYCLAACAN